MCATAFNAHNKMSRVFCISMNKMTIEHALISFFEGCQKNTIRLLNILN